MLRPLPHARRAPRLWEVLQNPQLFVLRGTDQSTPDQGLEASVINWSEAWAWLQAQPEGKARNQLFRLASSKVTLKPARQSIRFPKGTKPKSMKALKKEAWAAFSEFIRQRDADENGNCKCCTCLVVLPWRQMQAGHFESRLYESVLFDEKNVHAQCANCNMPPNNGMRIEYKEFLETTYGAGTAARLKARTYRRTMGRDELEKVLEKYLPINKEISK